MGSQKPTKTLSYGEQEHNSQRAGERRDEKEVYRISVTAHGFFVMRGTAAKKGRKEWRGVGSI